MWKGGWWMECDMLHAKRVVGRMWLLVVVACGMWREGFVRAERERRGACDGCGGLLEARERAERVVMAERTLS